MKAMLLREYRKLELVDMPTPGFGPDDLLVQVKACGICGSDIHGFDGSTGRRIPPIVMGHEAAGVVAACGENVDGFAVGDRVTFDSMISCGRCGSCRKGKINLCENRQILGVSCDEFRRNGAFAEYVVVPQHVSYKIPPSLPFEHAALIEAVSVAVHAANLAPVKLGSTAIVVGSGMIGLLVVQAIRLAGCSQVIAIDLDESKLKVAQSLGANVGLNPKRCDVIAEVKALTGGYGADVSFEVVGSTAAVNTAIEGTRKGGAITLVGNLSPTVEFPLQSVVTRELAVFGSCGSSGEYPECIELLNSGAIRVEPVITAKAKLEDGPEWFDRLYANEPGAMKIVLQPSA